MKTIERKGKSTSSIISGFMKEHNLKLEDFKFEVIDEGKKGFLGLFSTKPTIIRFFIQDNQDSIAHLTKTFFKKMDVDISDVKITGKGDYFSIELLGAKEAGFIIGKEARTLDACQYLINQMLNKQEKHQYKLELDVDGYRKRRKDQLVDKLKGVTERIKKTGKSFTFEPMEASRRKIIHQFVEKDKELQTMTIGKGGSKRVVISLAGKKNNAPRKNNNRNYRKPRKQNQKK